MMNTVNKQAVRNLLNRNKMVLMGLHMLADMDFEKPFIIMEREGNFTHNSILKLMGWDNFLKRDIDKFNTFVVYTDCYYDDCRMCVARLTASKFEFERDTIEGFEDRNGYRLLGTASRKVFEESRKNKNGHYFVISQSKAWCKPKENTELDIHARYRVREQYGHQDAILFDKNGDFYYDNVNKTMSYSWNKRPYEFDKSGYITKQNHYFKRLIEVKKQRDMQAMQDFDVMPKVIEFENRIHRLNIKIRNFLTSPTMGRTDTNFICNTPYGRISFVCDRISWIARDIRSLKNKTLNGMNAVKNTISHIDENITKAEKELEEI